ncbi:APC family permease [Rhodococcus sp. BGS-1C]|uniref:APC family permease n=1 Tax=unclassified Rhodococcus (in: high G+C Gram-positive bacteria) TaxID=192944 RepID=UPI0019D03841|nr:APC family permease [Rhodococcus sp. KRD197]
MNTSALRAALARAAVTDRNVDPVRSPLGVLGRRQLTQFDLLGQSLSTMAPATCMVFIALWMSTFHGNAGGLLAIIGATVVMVLVAICIRQFTARLAASGSLYSFVAHGLGKRATLTAGVALFVGYLGVSISVLSNAGENLVQVAEVSGARVGPSFSMLACVMVAAGVAMICIRGVRFATRTILVIEICTLVLITALLLRAPVHVDVTETTTSAPVGFVLFLIMQTVLSLAGFESAAFFGPEARTPLRTVTRTLLISPILVGCLYVFAGWAGMTGHAGTMLNAYFGGVESGASPLLVVAVTVGVCFSWIASTLGFAQAGSRLLFSMSIERIIPAAIERVHPTFRTPYIGVAVFVGASLIGALVHDPDGRGIATYDVVIEMALTLGYTLVSIAALRFLSRIGEHTLWTRLSGVLAAAAGLGLLGFAAADAASSGTWLLVIWLAALSGAGALWYALLSRYRPTSIASIGVFDTVETGDLLPGSSELTLDERGKPVLTPARHR